MGFLLLSIPALLLIAFIMLARANDLGWEDQPWPMRVRLIACIFAGLAPWGITGWDYYVMQQTPSFFRVMMDVATALVFSTTPQLPPLWRWISGWLPEGYVERRRP